MSLEWLSLVVDSADPAGLSAWWAGVLGYRVVWEEEDYVAIARNDRTFPGIVFVKNASVKHAKNRLHWDLNPSNQEEEVARLESLGAARVDIGQGDVAWIVMADPEGNEFCVLTPWTPPDTSS